MLAQTRTIAALLVLSPIVASTGGCGRPAPPAQPGEADYLARCDLPGGLSAYCRACASGSAGACITVARAYERGEEVARDDLGMVAFERRACELGSGRGCTGLGNSYRSGKGVVRSLDRGDALRSRGCAMSERKCDEEELPYECVSAARCRIDRREELEPKHVTHAESACDAGDRLACAVALDWSKRRPKPDPAHLAALLAHACRAGSQAGCQGLAAHLWLGVGVDADPEAARATFAELCTRGRAAACHAERGYMPFETLLPYLFGAQWSYPRDAINAGLVRNRALTRDKVAIGFCVAPDGLPARTVILAGSGNEDVDDGAAKGVRMWRFPYRPPIHRDDLCMQVTFCLPDCSD